MMAPGPLRPVAAMPMDGVTPAPLPDWRPQFARVPVTDLIVDGTYQRDLSERSLKLIRRIVASWDWARFKPPVVTQMDSFRFYVLDGQHTAIAAASHGGIETIPVIVVKVDDIGDRARAFIGHNKDRLVMTPLALFHAELAAGNGDAMAVQSCCQAAGIEVLRYNMRGEWFKPRQTTSIAVIAKMIERRGEEHATRVLKIAAESNIAPVDVATLRALDELLTADEYRDHVSDEGLARALRSIDTIDRQRIREMIEAKKLPRWRALAVILYLKRRGNGR